ncbi:MAG: exopolysaccharide transport family protein [Hyphomicrobium sp.]|uniref:GumC family protein n=1 Tax=Hyphomicrobium sp. TaxID=82 RepID=UPI0039E3568D
MPQPSEPLTANDVAVFIRYYWPTVAITVLVMMLLAVIYAFTASPKYTASAQLLIEPGQQQANLTLSNTGTLVAMDTPQIESQIAVLNSEQVVGKALDHLAALHQLPDAIGASNKPDQAEIEHSWLYRLFFGTPLQKSQSEVDAQRRAEIAMIQNGLDVRRVGTSYVLELSYRAGNPKEAADVANAIGDAYVQDVLDVRANIARQGGRWLEGRIEDLRRLMNELAIDVQEFKAKRDYRLVDRTDRSTVKPDDPLGLELPDAGAAPKAGPDVKKSPTQAEPAPAQTTLEELELRAQTYRRIYESFLQIYTETVQKQSYPGTNARVISRAEPPTTKSSPKRLLSIAAAAVLGTFLGFGIALARAAFDPTVRSSRQVRTGLGVPLLGAVGEGGLLASAPRLKRFLRGPFSTPQRRASALCRIVEQEPNSAIAQELIGITLALKEVAQPQNIRVIGIQDAGAGSSSGIIASNIALLNARAGNRTLLIEVDTANSNLAAALGITNYRSLQDLLAGKIGVAEAVIPAKGSPNLSYIIAAPKIPLIGAAEGTVRLRAIIDSLRAECDLILVHLPLADPGDRLSTVVDGMVLVSRARKTKLPELINIAADLRIANRPLLGAAISGL